MTLLEAQSATTTNIDSYVWYLFQNVHSPVSSSHHTSFKCVLTPLPRGVTGFLKVSDWFLGTPPPPGGSGKMGSAPQVPKFFGLFSRFCLQNALVLAKVAFERPPGGCQSGWVVFWKWVSGFLKVESGRPPGGLKRELWFMPGSARGLRLPCGFFYLLTSNWPFSPSQRGIQKEVCAQYYDKVKTVETMVILKRKDTLQKSDLGLPSGSAVYWPICLLQIQ